MVVSSGVILGEVSSILFIVNAQLENEQPIPALFSPTSMHHETPAKTNLQAQIMQRNFEIIFCKPILSHFLLRDRQTIFMRKQVLIITYYWPPAGGIAVQRITKFCKYLNQFGWNPIVLTVENGNYENIDHSLENDIKHVSKVYRTISYEPHLLYNCINSIFKKNKKSNTEPKTFQQSRLNTIAEYIRLNLFIPDTRIGWLLNAYHQGKQIIRQHKPELIFSTAPPYTPHLVAMKLHKFSNIPWIADFRDPWVESTLYNTVNRLKPVIAANRYLERKVLNKATALTFTGTQLRDLYLTKIDKNIWNKAHVITNGYDPEDFENIKGSETHSNKFHITYFGSLYQRRYSALVFTVIGDLIRENQDIAHNLCMRFIGSVDPTLQQKITNLIPIENVEYIPYVPYKESLSVLFQPQILLLIIDQVAHNETITLGKIFDYLPTGNPIMGVGPTNGDTAKMLNSTSAGVVYDYKDYQNVKNYILAKFSKWKKSDLKPRDVDLLDLQRNQLTRKLAVVFDNMLSA